MLGWKRARWIVGAVLLVLGLFDVPDQLQKAKDVLGVAADWVSQHGLDQNGWRWAFVIVGALIVFGPEVADRGWKAVGGKRQTQPDKTTTDAARGEPPTPAPQPPSPAPLPPYGRFPSVPSTVTPEYLINIFRDNMEAQAKGLVKPFLGRIIGVAEPVHNVSPDTDGITSVTLSRPPVVHVRLDFDTAKWGAHLAALKKGQVLSAYGTVADVTALWVRLTSCEIEL